MQRSVACSFDARLEGVSDIAISVAVATPFPSAESLVVTLDDRPLAPVELVDDHGTRLHHLSALGPGRLDVRYSATVTGIADPPPVDPVDLIRYVRPSRYCESDELGAVARSDFAGLEGAALLDAVSSWVGSHVSYLSGSSRPTDGAVTTFLSRQGVCRDFAHLVIALLRGCDVPARLVAVYAPGLSPMDLHAAAEAYVEGQWWVVDATCLAPRTAMVRIATGRDAADTAFLTSTGAPVRMGHLEVFAVVDPDLPFDDLTQMARLG